MKVLIVFILCGCISSNACISKQQTTEAWNKVENKFNDLGDKISDGFKTAKKSIVNTYNEVEPKVNDGLQKAETAIVDEFDKAETAVEVEINKIKNVVMDACKCVNYNCGCCAHLEEAEIHLNSTICTNITYLVKDYGISFTVTVNDYTLYNETVSARNPPPVCLGIPYVKEFAEVCIRLYDINATTSYLHLCIRVEARMKTILIAKYELGCINLGPPQLSIVPPVTIENEHVPFVKLLVAEDVIEKVSVTKNWAVPVIASSLAILIVITIVIGVFLAIKKRRSNNYLGLWKAKNGYGSTQSLVPQMDPYC